MAGKSSSSNRRARRIDWLGLLSRRHIAAGLFALAAIVASGASFLREAAAVNSPMARSRAELQFGMALAKRPDLAAKYWQNLALRDPLQSAAFVIKGITIMGGKVDQAAQVAPLMQAAMERQPNLDQPRVWLAAFHASNGDSDRAIREFDAALARSNGLVEPVLPVLVLLLQDPKSRPAMLARMRSFPRWRTPALIALINSGGLPQSEVQALLAASPRRGFQPLLDAERQALLLKLVADGQQQQAFTLFRRYAALDAAVPLYDGRFAAAQPMQPFGWKLASASEDYAERVANPAGGWLLRAHSSGKRDVALVEQTLGLSPGQWTVTMQARDGGLAKPENLALVVECVGGAAMPALARQTLGALRPAASDVSLRITVPESCGLQRLTLLAQESADHIEASEIEVLKFGVRR
jgi:tetratricopeptide (TPR) repeat protein